MDKLELINLALIKAGLPHAADLADVDYHASGYVPVMAEASLRLFDWNFATRYAVLPPLNVTPPHGWGRMYRLPSDYLRMIDVHCKEDLRSPECRYEVVGTDLYTNVSPCNIRYVWKCMEVERWPALFCDAVSTGVASRIAALESQSSALAVQLEQQWQADLLKAQVADAAESSRRVPIDDTMVAPRRLNSVGR